jgi:hypothetical protein
MVLEAAENTFQIAGRLTPEDNIFIPTVEKMSVFKYWRYLYTYNLVFTISLEAPMRGGMFAYLSSETAMRL